MSVRNHDEWIVERWRLEPKWPGELQGDEPPLPDQAPPLWKDLAVASIAAALLWIAAVALLG